MTIVSPYQPVPPVTWPGGLPILTNIQPFTYRDGITYADLLEQLREYIESVLVPAVNDQLKALGDAYVQNVQNVITSLLDQLNSAISQLNGAVTDAQAAQVAAETAAQLAQSLANGLTDASFASKVQDDTNPIGAAIASMLNALHTTITTERDNVLTGFMKQFVPGRNYKLVSGVLRNPSDGSGWDLITDSVHRAANIDSVTYDATNKTIIVDYTSMGATKVVGFVISPDEQFLGNGFMAGASVTLTQATISVARTGTLSDYVSWNGSAFTSQNGIFTADAMGASGTVTLHHDSVGSRFNGVSLSDRGNTYRTVVTSQAPAVTDTTVGIQFVNASGAVVTTPDANMKVFVSRNGEGTIDPALVKGDLADFWFVAFFEVD